MATARTFSFPVHPESGPEQRFVGHLTTATGRASGTLQVLLHGNSYDHRYWDPGLNDEYSYCSHMATLGYDLLAVDLPGVGESDRTEDGELSLSATASALAALIRRVREHGLGDRRYEHISVVGHSMGAAIGVHLESRWRVADSLVVTATGFTPSRPRGAWAPGAREALLSVPYPIVPAEGRLKFYHAASVDREVVDYDNAVLRTSIPRRLWADCIALQDDPEAGFAQVTCPVMVQLGEFDPILPARCAEDERVLYTAARQVEVHQVPDIGHSFNLHRNRQESWAAIAAFLDRKVG